MPTPVEAYRQGYERGRSDSAGGRLAEITMGMLRDDPGGHFQKGYGDGAGGMPFDPPSAPSPRQLQAKRLIPNFSENPIGWILGVLILIELWVLWQLVKAPFQLVGSLMRSEKPSPSVILKNAIIAVTAVVLSIYGITSQRTVPKSPASMIQGSSRVAGQADWSANLTNRHVSTTVNFNLSQDGGSTWQSFSLAPGATGLYTRMNRFKVVTNFPDGHTQEVNVPLLTYGVKYYSLNCPVANCTWDISGDDEFAAARAKR